MNYLTQHTFANGRTIVLRFSSLFEARRDVFQWGGKALNF